MTYRVYQHWDPLRVCVVGRSYPPEFYNWITVPRVRSLFERIAVETEEDYQGIIAKLESFGVTVLRPDLPEKILIDGRLLPPPMVPRNFMVMVGDVFYENHSFDLVRAYEAVRDSNWPVIEHAGQYKLLPDHIVEECEYLHEFAKHRLPCSVYDKIFEHIRARGNEIRSHCLPSLVNGSQLTRVGKNLFFGTERYDQDQINLQNTVDKEFGSYRNRIVNTGGHSDGTYCPVAPGLIISLKDVATYADTFPGWEVIYLPGQSWEAVHPFWKLKQKNRGKWWIPGFEHDQAVTDVVETWLSHWTGYVEETVFDVNIMIIDPKNVMVTNYNKQVFDALSRYGITPHVVPFRHRYFWDGGIHCVTADLHREGVMHDWFPDRS